MQLHLITSKDELRPPMNHILFTKEVMVATDGAKLGVIPTKHLLSEELIEEIPNEGVLVHPDDYKLMLAAENIVGESDNVWRLIYKKGNKRDQLIELRQQSDVGKYPNWEAVVPNYDTPTEAKEKIALNAEYLALLQKALGSDSLKLTFHEGNKPIKVEAKDTGRYGIIMPVLLW